MCKKVLIIGSGGREHAIYKAVAKSNDLDITVYPGNIGIQSDGGTILKSEKELSWDELSVWAKDNSIDLTIVGPEIPLVDGIVDVFEDKGLTIFGPSKIAAQLEGSKYYSKDLMKKYNIPTADWEMHNNKSDAMKYLEKMGAPIVIKVSGLAAGKGAIVCETMEHAKATLIDIFDDNSFGDAGSQVVIEEMMYGEEASIFVVTDGEEYKILPISQDHKRIFDNDEGPNTGGMGAYTPAPVINNEDLEKIEETIIKPTLKAMKSEGALYKGLLYVGVMMTKTGARVVEYNCRFGDPETEAVLPLVDCNWFDLFSASAKGGVAKVEWNVSDNYSATIIMASKGYPASSHKGDVITGIDKANVINSVEVYHAGTTLNANGEIVTNGGRVLAITGYAETLQKAIDKAYEGVKEIKFNGMQYRLDIGKKGLKHF